MLIIEFCCILLVNLGKKNDLSQHLRYILLINLAMLCISTSGALGRYIELPPPLTIWFRAGFAFLFLGAFCLYQKYKIKFDPRKYGFTIIITGILMTVHWVTYFYALQWSNVAVAMLSLFTYPMITTLLEPIFLKTKLNPIHVASGIFILIGIYFLVPDFDMNNGMTQGLLMGILSSVCYAIRNLILKTQIRSFNGSVLMFYQMAVMLLVLFPVVFLYDFSFSEVQRDLPYIIFLGLITTAVGHTLFLNSFKYFSATSASIMSSVQPIFGILMAMLFLSEFPDYRSMIGGGVIMLVVILNGLKK
ncbi:MAG: DMT family transporter [Saprospiraceae bacterium]